MKNIRRNIHIKINNFLDFKKMSEIFKRFEDEEYIFENEVPALFNYISVQINYYSPNYSYYKMFYDYCVRLKLVINWPKKNSFTPVAKLGEHICNEKKTLVNFIQDEQHWSCCGLYR